MKAYFHQLKAWLRLTKECFSLGDVKKQDAIQLLGGTPRDAARAIGITPQAFGQWPEELPRRLADRVEAAIARRLLPSSAFCVSSKSEKSMAP